MLSVFSTLLECFLIYVVNCIFPMNILLILQHVPGTDEMRQEHPGYWTLVKRKNVTKLRGQVGVEVTVNTDGVVVTISSWYDRWT